MAIGKWQPTECPKDGGELYPIPNMDDAWKCPRCGLEIWDGELPTKEEYENDRKKLQPLQSASFKPYISRSFVQLPKGSHSGSSGGGGRKKKKKLNTESRYRTYF